jgi:hypothetical protein
VWELDQVEHEQFNADFMNLRCHQAVVISLS